MQYILDTVDTIPEGLGFPFYGAFHLAWLAVFIATVTIACFIYRKLDPPKRQRFRKILAGLIVADEIFKMAILTIGGNYIVDYVPLHLCSINIFLIAIHAFMPSRKSSFKDADKTHDDHTNENTSVTKTENFTEVLGNYLYTVGIPGAMAALLFPSWASLPPLNLMNLHSFTIHIMLAAYPIILTVGEDIRPQIKHVPKALLLLCAMAIPVYIFNMIFDTNFMFLMYADPGNPLYIFEQMWGNHLLGLPIIIAAILIVMHGPWVIWHARKKK